MSQVVDDIQHSYPLFRKDEYKDTLSNKQQQFEEQVPSVKIDEIFQWTTTEEYKELNFAREALTVNPAKTCQPVGAMYASLGIHGCLPHSHGSQGCYAYHRSALQDQPALIDSALLQDEKRLVQRIWEQTFTAENHRTG